MEISVGETAFIVPGDLMVIMMDLVTVASVSAATTDMVDLDTVVITDTEVMAMEIIMVILITDIIIGDMVAYMVLEI